MMPCEFALRRSRENWCLEFGISLELGPWNLELSLGWVAEWSNAHAWTACLPQGTQGYNPCPSFSQSHSPFTLRRFSTCKVWRTFTTLALGNTPRKFAPG